MNVIRGLMECRSAYSSAGNVAFRQELNLECSDQSKPFLFHSCSLYTVTSVNSLVLIGFHATPRLFINYQLSHTLSLFVYKAV